MIVFMNLSKYLRITFVKRAGVEGYVIEAVNTRDILKALCSVITQKLMQKRQISSFEKHSSMTELE